MRCKKCEDKGFTIEHRVIEVFCRHDCAKVDDFVYYEKACTCVLGESFYERQSSSLISEAYRINNFIDTNKRPFRTIKKMLNDYINEGIRHYEGRGRYS